MPPTISRDQPTCRSSVTFTRKKDTAELYRDPDRRGTDWMEESYINGEISLNDQILSEGERIELDLVHEYDRVMAKMIEDGCLIVAGQIVQFSASSHDDQIAR